MTAIYNPYLESTSSATVFPLEPCRATSIQHQQQTTHLSNQFSESRIHSATIGPRSVDAILWPPSLQDCNGWSGMLDVQERGAWMNGCYHAGCSGHMTHARPRLLFYLFRAGSVNFDSIWVFNPAAEMLR
ncbi:hypothetical protein E2562_026672 [Oryza meyeriana var. granulata]|uniref:Uncharacterized protein n=1 Tax=Oryza meyeriana var. granulata TaxID=110450 RepID=A0A6G1BYW3_9ORYZ|nr:hypothetical protein E2562_026672 [Oryza meyeriana var. granulata]